MKLDYIYTDVLDYLMHYDSKANIATPSVD